MMDTLSIKKLEDFNKNIAGAISAPVQAPKKEKMMEITGCPSEFHIGMACKAPTCPACFPGSAPKQNQQQMMEESKEPV